MKRIIVLIPVMIALALVACAKPPQEAIDAAEAAVARALGSSDVLAYSREDLQRAKNALDQMRAEVAARHYDKAKTFATEAATAADTAIAAAQSNKGRAKTRAEELITAVKQALPRVDKLLAGMTKVKKAKIDVTAKKTELDGARTALAEAETAFAQSDYLKALDKAGSAQKTLADIESEIGTAVQSATRKK